MITTLLGSIRVRLTEVIYYDARVCWDPLCATSTLSFSATQDSLCTATQRHISRSHQSDALFATGKTESKEGMLIRLPLVALQADFLATVAPVNLT